MIKKHYKYLKDTFETFITGATMSQMENPYTLKTKNPKDLSKSQKAFCDALAIRLRNGDSPIKINVSDICRTSGLSRTTFYANYKSVSDVFDDLEDVSINNFAIKFNTLMDTGFDPESFERAMRTYIDTANDRVSTMVAWFIVNKSPAFYDKWTRMLHWRLYPLFASRDDSELVLGVFVNVTQYCIRTYLENPEKYSSEQLSKSIHDLYEAFISLKK